MLMILFPEHSQPPQLGDRFIRPYACTLISCWCRCLQYNGLPSLIWHQKPGSIFCSPATQLMFSRQGVVGFWLCFLFISLYLSLSLSESHQNKPRPKILQSCIVPPTNYKAVHAQPSFISDKNNTKIENHSTHLENMVRQKGVNQDMREKKWRNHE